MRYSMPNYPCEFELPDEWISESGITSFNPNALAYRSNDDAQLVSLSEIVPVPRVQAMPE